MMDPSRNNMPLQFNMNKNKAPMPITRTSSDIKEDDMPSSTTHNLMGNCEQASTDQGNMMGMYNMMGQMVGPIPGDPNMMMMGPIFGGMQGPMQGSLLGPGPMGGIGPMGGPGLMGPSPQGIMGPPLPMKEIIRLKSSVLYPPPPGAPPRSTREKPFGCRTIFVGGIPENSTEDLLFEVFENCGPIQSIRISKKNFSHIRFENMDSVERALYISGYRMKINDSDTKEDTGRVHVDYAHARDDQYDFECHQRAMAREMRHMQRMEEERHRPPSPPPVLHFTDHEASLLLEKLKSDENFPKASQILMTWLERGECNRRTFTTFYSMIQNVYGQLRRLGTERDSAKDEFEHYKTQHQQRLQGLIGQICQVERVLLTAHKQRCWDQFTKAQRKNIDTWLRQAQEIRETQDEDDGVKAENEVMNEDMDFSDDDEAEQDDTPATKKRKATASYADSADSPESHKLKEENDTLKCQMEAFKNEVDTVRQEGRDELDEQGKQIKALQNALQGMQQQLISQRSSVTTLEKEKKELETKLKENEETSSQQTSSSGANSPAEKRGEDSPTTVTSSGLTLSNKEAKILGLICCFLHVHPHGATVDYLWSYLSQLTTVRVRELEDLLEKMPSIFEQRIIGVGAAIERRWIFTALTDSVNHKI